MAQQTAASISSKSTLTVSSIGSASRTKGNTTPSIAALPGPRARSWPWLNSDDKYLPWTFSVVRDIFDAFPQVEWLTSLYPLIWNDCGQAVRCSFLSGFDRASFFRGANMPAPGKYARAVIQQESTFWRRSLWERAGSRIDDSLKLAGDYELWARFYRQADLYGVGALIAGFRLHGGQKTAHQAAEYLGEAEEVLRRYGGRRYGRGETLLRRLLALFEMETTLNRLVARDNVFFNGWGRTLERLGMVSRSPVIVSEGRSGGWHLESRYIV